jgi:hypothetical protein
MDLFLGPKTDTFCFCAQNSVWYFSVNIHVNLFSMSLKSPNYGCKVKSLITTLFKHTGQGHVSTNALSCNRLHYYPYITQKLQMIDSNILFTLLCLLLYLTQLFSFFSAMYLAAAIFRKEREFTTCAKTSWAEQSHTRELCYKVEVVFISSIFYFG